MNDISRLHLLRQKSKSICAKCHCYLLVSCINYTLDEGIWNKSEYNCEKVQKPEKTVILTPSKY